MVSKNIGSDVETGSGYARGQKLGGTAPFSREKEANQSLSPRRDRVQLDERTLARQ